ncbi:MAG: 50S ribosomal protein L23 [bacterium]|nr:50S ribosomal protein L23 [bacterium]
MALFTRNKKSLPPVAITPARIKPAAVASGISAGLSHILKHARVTEKATMHQGVGVYTFDIAERATKRDVMQAVRALYGVSPRMVRVVSIPRKVRRSVRTGKRGTTGGGKKAYVYLKKGETITIS